MTIPAGIADVNDHRHAVFLPCRPRGPSGSHAYVTVNRGRPSGAQRSADRESTGGQRRATVAPAPRWRPRLARAWPTARYVLGLGLAGLAFYQLSEEKGELAEATSALSHLHWGWVVVAALAEAASIVALASLQRRLLAAGRACIPLGPMTAITFAANAIANSIPAGSVIATV